MNRMNLYKTKNDIIFRYIFSKEEYLKYFLEAILKVKIAKIKVENNYELTKENIYDKVGKLDIRAIINEEHIVDLEMQNRNYASYEKRIFLYFGSLIRNQIKESEDYDVINDIIIINILNETRFKEIEDFHIIWHLRERDYRDLKLNGIEIHFIELDKFRKSRPDLENVLNQWLAFIDSENKEMEEEVMEKNKEIRKAVNDKKNSYQNKKNVNLWKAILFGH